VRINKFKNSVFDMQRFSMILLDNVRNFNVKVSIYIMGMIT
jgi:hypothetical protein